ncbi:hypothetical protein JA33_314 [Dickeya phage vB_DsoM_JA33]|uniref:Uncharacterized protein n=3 Tax=Salmondvirus JA11 TaxID=2734141 RepID=A0A384ZWW7_9CAUD|nr:hypothetical protein HOU32_gp314 [Dickeya phage vB_DsoM_JA11]AXG66719.1 hypothetical protein JA13_316 [Dickeya phage vB_DsoM_JA13]AXG67688.1 hypothetical protein JA33_314 [Dickeya phage vB_DsoM_JA33]AYD80119.1 hypothetical protein JA11_314 [Dickeya phage vB_DsoM_JA11]
MDLHSRFKKLNEDLLELQQAVHRVVRISPSKFAVCFYDRHEQSLRTNVIDSRTAHEIKLIQEMSGAELQSYGAFVSAIQEWCEAESPGEFPIPLDKADSDSYRTLIDAMTIRE